MCHSSKFCVEVSTYLGKSTPASVWVWDHLYVHRRVNNGCDRPFSGQQHHPKCQNPDFQEILVSTEFRTPQFFGGRIRVLRKIPHPSILFWVVTQFLGGNLSLKVSMVFFLSALAIFDGFFSFSTHHIYI